MAAVLDERNYENLNFFFGTCLCSLARFMMHAVLAAGGVEKVSITKGLVRSDLKQLNADKEVEQHAEREKRRRQEIVRELENKKKKNCWKKPITKLA
ncbi:hypothetical protein PR048_028524 [Dryococelus australis]|uniref:Uncharacterized protein n=1 Tax=Dryococelus australis TaxID=614101 RepID=A0ABQ9GDK4_9NEOP|nr:hypothetical protein PR048_028524 [Dryococelus australis]